MRSRWFPLLILAIGVFALGSALVSLAVGEHKEEDFAITGSGDVQELLGGIPQLGNRLGDSDAPVTIDLFNDVQCTRCADYQLNVVDPLITDYVRTGEIQMIFRHYPLGVKPVTLGGIGSTAAGQQDREWQYAELFIRNLDEVPEQGVNQEFLNEVASSVPKMDVTAWEAVVEGDEAEQSARDGNDLATQLKIPADPAVVVTGPTGSQQLDGAPTLEEIEAVIEAVS